MKKAVCLAFALISGSAMAGEIYTGAGTVGFKLGYAQALTDTVGLRAEFNYLDYSRDFNTSDANYTGKIKMNNVGAYLDYFPFSNGFRLSAGALVGNNKITADGKASGGNYTINGQQYSATGQSVSASAAFPNVQPYVGLGYGYSPTAKKGLGFFADIGAAYGKPDATLNVSQGLLTKAGQANVNAEQQKMQDELDKFKFYPVLNIGLSYTF